MMRASASPELTRKPSPVPSSVDCRLRGQVDRRVGRGQEADERQADLGDRQEPARLADQRLDTTGASIAFVDELVDPGAAHRHQRDLGGDEDPLEQRQDDDDEERDDGVH